MNASITVAKPQETVKKTDNVKIQGDMIGLETGKTYILQMRVVEDYTSGGGVSDWVFKVFTVVD